jgi:hypothetical protein
VNETVGIIVEVGSGVSVDTDVDVLFGVSAVEDSNSEESQPAIPSDNTDMRSIIINILFIVFNSFF